MWVDIVFSFFNKYFQEIQLIMASDDDDDTNSLDFLCFEYNKIFKWVMS